MIWFKRKNKKELPEWVNNLDKGFMNIYSEALEYPPVWHTQVEDWHTKIEIPRLMATAIQWMSFSENCSKSNRDPFTFKEEVE